MGNLAFADQDKNTVNNCLHTDQHLFLQSLTGLPRSGGNKFPDFP